MSLFSDVKIVDTSKYDTKGKRSRYLKTTLRETVEGDYLYIDSDTIICDKLDDIDFIESEMALVIDVHTPKEYYEKIYSNKFMSEWGKNMPVEKCYNCGVSLVKDTPNTHLFFKRWYENWNEQIITSNIFIDQPTFYKTVSDLDFHIDELNGEWNCQINGSFLGYLNRAKIIHTFTAQSDHYIFKLADRKYLQQIKHNADLTESIKEMLLHPKDQFNELSFVLSGPSALFVRTETFQQFLVLYANSSLIYKSLKVIIRCFLTLYAYQQMFKSKICR